MINTAYFLTFILVFLRMIGFFAVLPIFFPKGFPNTAKVGFTLMFSFMLMPGINLAGSAAISSNYTLIFNCINEVVTGLTLGFITNLCFFSIRMAGQFIDTQIGFSMVSMFDPASNSNATLLENLLYWFSVLTFFAVDGHQMLIKSLIDSYSAIAIGRSPLGQDSILLLIKAFTEFFSIGVKIAIPIVLIILITDITIGLIGRTVPQLNLMVLGFPIKILVGLSFFSLALPILYNTIVSSFGTLQDLFKGFFNTLPKVLPFVIVFAADDKTEEATPKKKGEARKKGQVVRSKEVTLAITLLACTLVLVVLGGYVGSNLEETLITFLGSYLNINLDYTSLYNLSLIVIWKIAVIFFPVVLPIMIMGILSNFLQTGFLFTFDPLKPSLSKINPISGFKKMFSARSFVELIKQLAIVTVLGYTGYSFLMSNYPAIMNMSGLRTAAVPSVFGKIVMNIFFKVTLIMVIIALIDYMYQRYKYRKELRMSKQEVKEEFKQQEGDPQIKGKIRQRMREMARKRMIQAVPSATVVVTNPTHIAVALKYQEGESTAPLLVAKGADNLAIRIKEVAKENKVPIIENRPLARLIYEKVEVDSEIPVEMYQAVAEILALVYKLNKKR